MSGLTVLASYPKSGNTWLRAFLESVRSGGNGVDINMNMAGVCAAADRAVFDSQAERKSADLRLGEIMAERPDIWRRVLRSTSSPPWIKTHDALMSPIAGAEPMFPPDVIGAAIYVVRDPRDVAISFAHHFGIDIDAAIACLGDEMLFLDLDADMETRQLPQFLSSWSRHVASWLDAPAIRCLVVRYEDMHATPVRSFGTVARFLGFGISPQLINCAISAASFEALQAQESRNGFHERDATTQRFFRKGKPAAWQEGLTAAQAQEIVNAHGPMMQRLGYI
jgi:hypothetical protein